MRIAGSVILRLRAAREDVKMTTTLEKAEQRIILQDVSWRTYEDLLKDCEDRSSPRLTYDRGVLEIMSPSAEHEEYNRTISMLVEVVAEELSVDIRNLGSTTFKLHDQLRGTEPDSCFYIQHADSIAGKTSVDLAVDPPPDLVIEIDISRNSMDKLAVYAAIGVPEIWRFDGSALSIFRIAGQTYEEADRSAAMPALTKTVIEDFLNKSKKLSRTSWLKTLRRWVTEPDR
jgi:Uma2 family endonuclease